MAATGLVGSLLDPQNFLDIFPSGELMVHTDELDDGDSFGDSVSLGSRRKLP